MEKAYKLEFAGEQNGSLYVPRLLLVRLIKNQFIRRDQKTVSFF